MNISCGLKWKKQNLETNIDIFTGQSGWQFPMPSNREISGGRTYIDDVLIDWQSFSYLFRWWPELVLPRPGTWEWTHTIKKSFTISAKLTHWITLYKRIISYLVLDSKTTGSTYILKTESCNSRNLSMHHSIAGSSIILHALEIDVLNWYYDTYPLKY